MALPILGPAEVRTGGPNDLFGKGWIDGDTVEGCPFNFPVAISSLFGSVVESHRTNPHSGLDLASNGIYGRPVRCPVRRMEVELVGTDSSRGNFLVGRDLDSGYALQFYHLRDLPQWTVGTLLQRQDQVGLVGNTGNVWTSAGGVSRRPRPGSQEGAHLHLGVEHPSGSVNVNPLQLFTSVVAPERPTGIWEPSYAEAQAFLQRAFQLDPEQMYRRGGLGYEVEAMVEENREWIHISRPRR